MVISTNCISNTRNAPHSAQNIGFDTLQQRSLDASPPHSLTDLPTSSLLSLTSAGSGRAGTGTESNPLSLSGELNLTSLSSDSGVHTGKASDMSEPWVALAGGSGVSTDDAEPAPAIAVAVADDDRSSTGDQELAASGVGQLMRKNSVRERANMFQALEKQRHVRKCEYTLWAAVLRECY